MMTRVALLALPEDSSRGSFPVLRRSLEYVHNFGETLERPGLLEASVALSPGIDADLELHQRVAVFQRGVGRLNLYHRRPLAQR